MDCCLRRHALLGLSVAVAAALVGCAGLQGISNSVTGMVPAYKVSVVQGNFISKEQVAELRPGMGRQQVADLLGTPLLASVFHADRWDYSFSMKTQDVEPISRKLTVFFKGEALERFEGDEMLTEAEFAAKIAPPRSAAAVVPTLEASEESLKAFAPAAPKDAAPSPAPAVTTAPTVYPPLEPVLR